MRNPAERCYGNFYLPVILFTAALVLSSCGRPYGIDSPDSGTLRLTIEPGETKTIPLLPVVYEFSGTGPEGDTFSMMVGGSSAAVYGLKAGEWTVRVTGLSEDGVVLLEGESLITVEADVETPVNITLVSASGIGDISVTAAWNGEYTINPSVLVTVTGADGEISSGSLSAAGDGTASGVLKGLPTGSYHVSVQLFDSGSLVMGSARVLRVYKDTAVEMTAQFENLNKVGMPVEVKESSFTIGWDTAPDAGPEAKYRVYYRARGEAPWNLLAEIEAEPDQQFTISSDILPYGTYEFAVSLAQDGLETGLHTSMDDDARPGTGWYVTWTGP